MNAWSISRIERVIIGARSTARMSLLRGGSHSPQQYVFPVSNRYEMLGVNAPPH
jgi:hypothetical protein